MRNGAFGADVAALVAVKGAEALAEVEVGLEQPTEPVLHEGGLEGLCRAGCDAEAAACAALEKVGE